MCLNLVQQCKRSPYHQSCGLMSTGFSCPIVTLYLGADFSYVIVLSLVCGCKNMQFILIRQIFSNKSKNCYLTTARLLGNSLQIVRLQFRGCYLTVLELFSEAQKFAVKRKVFELVFVRCLNVQHGGSLDLNVPHDNVVAAGERHVVALLCLEELRPRVNEEETTTMTRDVLYQDILIVLGRVGAHLQPQHTIGVLRLATTQDDVAVVQRLRA